MRTPKQKIRNRCAGRGDRWGGQVGSEGVEGGKRRAEDFAGFPQQLMVAMVSKESA